MATAVTPRPPSGKQKRLIESWRLPCPPTAHEASLMITYILDSDTGTVREKVRLFRHLTGARVKIATRQPRCGNMHGSVVRLRMLTAAEQTAIRQVHPAWNPKPYEAIVAVEELGGKLSCVPVSRLTVLEEKQQPWLPGLEPA